PSAFILFPYTTLFRSSVLALLVTFRRLAKVAILITKLQTKREIQTYEKVLYEIRNRHFCQTASYMPFFFFSMVCLFTVSFFFLLDRKSTRLNSSHVKI